MSLEKFKTVSIGEQQFRIGRLAPAAGSFILGQLMSANVKRMQSLERTSEMPRPGAVVEMPNPEQLVRAASMGAFLGGLDYETHAKIQQMCFGVVSLMTGANGATAPLPIATGDGHVLPEIGDDLTLVMRLEMEVLVFNLTDFFAHGGLNALTTLV